MKKLSKFATAGLAVVVLLSLYKPVLAYGPVLVISNQYSDNVTLSVSGGYSNSSVQLNYTPPGTSFPTVINNFGRTDNNGYYTTTISRSAYGISSGSLIYVVISGQQSNSVSLGNDGGSGCTYNCGGSLSLSQTTLNLNQGQSTSITAYNLPSGSTLSVYNNTNSSVASAYASGNQITITGNSVGSTSINICSSYGTMCASVYVTVNNNGGCTYNCGNNLSLSQNNVSLNIGQTSAVTAYNYSGGSIYISSNSNSFVATASVSGNQISILGNNNGSATISVCASNGNSCANIYVTVSGNSGSNISLSQSYLTLNVGQTASVTVYNAYALSIGSNSNSYVGYANFNSNIVTVTASSPGSTTINICSAYSTQCVPLYVTVNSGSGNNSNIVSIRDNYYSPSVITVSVGTTVVWNNNGSSVHTVTADDWSFNSGNLYSGNSYSRVFNSVGTFTYHCNFHGGMTGTVIVTNSGSSGSVFLSQSNLTLNSGQTSNVTIYGGTQPYTIINNSSPSVASAAIYGNNLSVIGNASGSTTINICSTGNTNNNQCALLGVTVSGYGGSGGLYFTTTTLPQPVAGQYYSYQLQVSGGNPPFAYYVSSGTLPAGLNLSSSGLIYGTPQYSTSANFSVRVSDTYNRSAIMNFTFGGVLGSLTYNNGTLIQEGNTIYITYKNTKAGFANMNAFRGLGYKLNNVQRVSNSGLTLSSFVVTSSNSAHPWGSWILNGSTIYFVHQDGLIPISSYDTFTNNGGQSHMVVPSNIHDFARPILPAMGYNDTRLR